MKKVLIGLLIVIALIAAIVAAVFYFTADVTRTGDRFFALIRDGNIKAAYQSTAREFQAATSEDQFMAFLKSSSIAEYQSATWTSRSISNNVGELEGSLKTKGGGVIPVKVKFVKENGKWKLLSIEKAAAGIVADSTVAVVPADADLIGLTNNSVLMLGQAINAGNFASFYSSTAKLWQNQTTADAIKQIFQSFIDQKVDLTVIQGKNPEFSEKASIDGNGRLILKGFYLVQPAKVNFTLKYIQEDKQWKLVGINVSQEEAASPAKGVMPSQDELTALAHGAVSLLAQAVAKDDFSELYNSISKRWQAQTSREEIRNAFSVFIEKKIPLTVIEGKKPEFTGSPRIDDHGALVMEGKYNTEPFRVLFNLEFWNEDSQWKLQALNVRTKSD
jgi:uncharacterized protein YxeA/2C-methyl-D-erythritol 2,4-cyclodiphosphate synthase